MTWNDDEGWGDAWDIAGEIIPDLIAYPLKAYIKTACEEQGIDVHNPDRIIATSVASAVVGSFIGALVSGPVGLLVGILGYGIGMTASYPSDRTKSHPSRMKAKEAILLEVARVATSALKARVSQNTWENICNEVQKKIAPYLEDRLPEPSPMESLQMVYEAMCSVNSNAADQWARVIVLGLKELEIDL